MYNDQNCIGSGSTKMIKLSICVIAHNEEQFLPGLLENIRKQTYPHHFIEVVLVDGMSVDKTKKLMKKF